MSSSEAEERLRNQSFSSFLVRESHSKPGDFVLSILSGDKNVTHVMIIKEVEHLEFTYINAYRAQSMDTWLFFCLARGQCCWLGSQAFSVAGPKLWN